MTSENADLKRLAEEDYKYGFVSDIEADQLPPHACSQRRR